MKTKYLIIALALLFAPTVMAQDYFAKLRYYYGDNSPIVRQQNTLKVHNTFLNPETGEREGELTVYKFAVEASNVCYIDSVKVLYQSIENAMNQGEIPKRNISTLWSVNGNKDRGYAGYRLYHNASDYLIVGTDADNCYTVGVIDDNSQFRTTYTIEWNEAINDSATGRLITTYAPIKHSTPTSSSIGEPLKNQKNSSMWMKKMFFYLSKLKDADNDSRHLYLSALFSLIKSSDMLNQDDLRVAIGQIKLSKEEFERKHKDASSTLLLQQLTEILEARLSR